MALMSGLLPHVICTLALPFSELHFIKTRESHPLPYSNNLYRIVAKGPQLRLPLLPALFTFPDVLVNGSGIFSAEELYNGDEVEEGGGGIPNSSC